MQYQTGTIEDWTPERSAAALMLQQVFGLGETASGEANLRALLTTLQNVGKNVLSVISAFFLSILFSFLIVLDLKRLSALVQKLEHTKLSFVYREVGPGVYQFGAVMGRAFEAQFFIAILNTFLTGLGLWFLGLTGKLAFLLMIVFFCSFIPIAGVFISSVPICLLALQQSGIGLMFLTILMITVVHLVEAYILNPRIFGHHLRLNPVLVLIVLTIGGELFGMWGFLLGLPVCTYIFKYAIRVPASKTEHFQSEPASA